MTNGYLIQIKILVILIKGTAMERKLAKMGCKESLISEVLSLPVEQQLLVIKFLKKMRRENEKQKAGTAG